MPKRLKRQRTKGWRKPEGAVICSRPSKYGNPFSIDKYGRNGALRKFDSMLANPELRKEYKYPSDEEIRLELRGKDLLCFCELFDCCHVDKLLEIANK